MSNATPRQVEFELQLAETVLINPYLDFDTPRVDQWDEARSDLIIASQAIVEYSVDVLRLAQGNTDAAAVRQLIALIVTLDQSIHSLPTANDFVPGYEIDTVLNIVAQQKDLFHAMRSAAPVLNGIAATVRHMVAETNDRFDLAFLEVYEQVMKIHEPVLQYGGVVVDRQNDTLRLLLLLEEARAGGNSSWQSMREADDELNEIGPPTKSAYSEAEAILLERLALSVSTRAQLEPAYREYQAVLRELYAIENNVKEILQITQFVIEGWDKAQRTLAAGRPSSFAEVTASLLRLAYKKAME